MLFSQDIDPNNPESGRFFLIRWVRAVLHALVPPTQAHQDRQSSSAKLIGAWAIVITCVVAMVAAIVYAKPLHGEYKEWRAERMIQDGRDYLAKDDVVNAVITAQKAVAIAPEYEPAVRLNAELLTMMGRNEAVYFWGKLDSLGVTTLDDEMGRVRALLRIHRDKEAAQQLEGLLKKNPSDTRLMKLAEEVWGKLQGGGVIMQVLKDHSRAHPEDRESKLRLLKLQMQTNTLDPAELRSSLWKVSDGDDATSLDALHLLTTLNSLDATERDRLADRLDTQPLAEEDDHIAALGIRVASRPSQRNQLIDAAISRVHGMKPDKLVPLVRWLVLNGEPGRILNMLSEEDLKKNEGLLTNYLNALTMLGRNADLERLVNDKEMTLRAPTRSFYLAHLALIKGEPREDVRAKLFTVLTNLSKDGQGDALLLLGRYCQDREFYDVAESAFETAANMPRARIERPGYVAWINCCRLSGNTDGVIRAAKEASRRWPDDQSFLESLLYARLLQGDEIELSLARAERLLAANPKDSVRKLIVALGYWQLRDLDNSVAASQEMDLRSVPEKGQQAVFAALVHEAGPARVTEGNEPAFREAMKSILTPINGAMRMLPEEKELLRRAQR